MSAFPATALLPKQYSRLCTSWTKNSDGNVAGPIFEELSTVLHGVDYHTSVPRVKGPEVLAGDLSNPDGVRTGRHADHQIGCL